MIKAECDRCGTQAETSGSVVGLTIGIMQTRQTKLPAGWHRVPEPVDDERVEWPRRELCPKCVEALRSFFRGDGAVPGLLSPEVLTRLEAESVIDQSTIRPMGCIAHGGPDCICPPETCTRPGHECGTPGAGPCNGLPKDPRPNLTERARKIAAGELCVCAGVGFGTEDCPAHHPNGVAEGTHLPCSYGREGDECPGMFRRGLFAEHMDRWHGVPVAPGSKPCPYCSDIHPGPNLGGHIAKAHPGDWQAWIDGGQNAG